MSTISSSPPLYVGDTTPSSLHRIICTTLSYDTNLMHAAVISLLLVILFILLLHLYTRWFLNQARTRSHSSGTVPHVLHSRLHRRFTIIDVETPSTKLGLHVSIISSLPLFVFEVSSKEGQEHAHVECAICLSVFEDQEIGRKLPGCSHAFHVECIDMWLSSHSTCPICRKPIECERNDIRKMDGHELEMINNDGESVVEIVHVDTEQLWTGPSALDGVRPSDSSSRSGGKIHPNCDGNESEV